MDFAKSLRRAIRYHPLIERAQQIVRASPSLRLDEVGIQLDVAKTDILIDCGANVGDITSRFARTGATVFAFEPNPVCYQLLLNRFRATLNVHLIHAGVMDRDCVLTLSIPKPRSDWDALDVTIAGSFAPNLYSDHVSYDVQCLRLSDFIRSKGRPVKLLKIDVEGAEIEVLNDLIETKTIDMVDLTVVEVHDNQRPDLIEPTDALRGKLAARGLLTKVRLDWI